MASRSIRSQRRYLLATLYVHACAGYRYTSAYVSIRQHTYATEISSRLRWLQVYVSIRQHTSAYVRNGDIFSQLYTCTPALATGIRQHTSAFFSIRTQRRYLLATLNVHACDSYRYTSAYVSIRQHTYATEISSRNSIRARLLVRAGS
jgi:hypothetical protein